MEPKDFTIDRTWSTSPNCYGELHSSRRVGAAAQQGTVRVCLLRCMGQCWASISTLHQLSSLGGEGQADADRGNEYACGKRNRPARQASDVVSISASSLAQACDRAPEAVLLGASVMEVCARCLATTSCCGTGRGGPGEMKMLVPAAMQRRWPMRDRGAAVGDFSQGKSGRTSGSAGDHH
jgi:hypothetical protein